MQTNGTPADHVADGRGDTSHVARLGIERFGQTGDSPDLHADDRPDVAAITDVTAEVFS